MSWNDQDLSEGVVVVMECPSMTSPRFISEEKATTFALPVLWILMLFYYFLPVTFLAAVEVLASTLGDSICSF